MKKYLVIIITTFSLSMFSQSKGDTFRNEGDLEKAVEALNYLRTNRAKGKVTITIKE